MQLLFALLTLLPEIRSNTGIALCMTIRNDSFLLIQHIWNLISCQMGLESHCLQAKTFFSFSAVQSDQM